jgi:predicted dehydrogenase
MRACVVGLGSIGRRYAKILHLHNIVFDVVSTGKGSLTQSLDAQELYGQVGFSRCYKSLDEACHRDIYDFWIIATPSVFHSQQAAELLEKGHNVFLEKPVAVNLQDITLLEAKLQGYKGIAGVAYTLRAHPYVRRLFRIIQEKKLGDPKSANVVWSSYLPAWHTWENFRTGYASRVDMGGGVTLTCSHELDLILYLFGHPSRWMANTSSNSHLDIPVDDCLDALFTFKSGMSCHLHLDFFQRNNRRLIEVLFDNGYVRIDLNQHALQLFDGETREESLGDSSADIWSMIYQYQLSSYINAVNGGGEERLFATLQEGLETALVCDQIRT